MRLVDFTMVLEDPKTKTKSKTDFKPQWENPQSRGEVSTKRKTSDAVPGKTASKEKTRSSFRSPDVDVSDKLANLANSGIEDEISDADAARLARDDVGHEEVTTPETLPAVINQAISNQGMDIDPQWHMVKNLPGYLQSAIRGLGRMIFSNFTDTPIEEIQVLSTLSNEENEVKAVMSWLKKNGIRDDEAELNFENIMPGYSSNVQIWNSHNATFMVVKDFAGYYVYGWPGGRGVAVSKPQQTKRLR